VLLNPRHQNAFADSSDLAFLAMLLDRLRSGMQPSSRALEHAPFVEQWAVVGAGEMFELTGLAWRLPLRRSAFAAPLLAIDPASGWARTVTEWAMLGETQPTFAVESVAPQEVTRRAEVWIRQQLLAESERTANRFFPELLQASAV
jgi:hypothetical protein